MLVVLTALAHADVYSVRDLAAQDAGTFNASTVGGEVLAEDGAYSRFATRHDARTDEYLLSTTLVCEVEEDEGRCLTEQRTWTLAGEPVGHTAQALDLWLDADTCSLLYLSDTDDDFLGWRSVGGVALAILEAGNQLAKGFQGGCNVGPLAQGSEAIDMLYVEKGTVTSAFIPGGSVVSAPR